MSMINADKNSFNIAVWAGGKTTEIAIYPKTARYADRDFLFRISTSTVELPESDFTVLPDYIRMIAVIDGDMSLSHDDGTESCTLKPLETVHTFDGAANTHCIGRCSDLNLMIRKGAAEGSMCFAEKGDTLKFKPSGNEHIVVYGIDTGRSFQLSNGNFSLNIDERSAVFSIKLITDRKG